MVAGAVVGSSGRLDGGVHLGFDKSLNTPLVVLVCTTVEYFVLVLISQAVACEQLHFKRGNVPPFVLIDTRADIVVVSGIACATTIQYLSPF